MHSQVHLHLFCLWLLVKLFYLLEQEFGPELLFGTSMFPCLQVLSSKMDLPYVNYLPAGPVDPVFNFLWRGTNFRAALPNPISYLPQIGMTVASQQMVSTI